MMTIVMMDEDEDKDAEHRGHNSWAPEKDCHGTGNPRRFFDIPIVHL